MVTLCTQSFAQISAIIFSKNPKMAMTLAVIIVFHMNMLGNVLIPMKDTHYALQAMSQLSYFRHSFELIIISIYGFQRCDENSISLVLHEFDIESQNFYNNLFNLVLICIALKAFTIFLLIFKINTFLKTDKKVIENEKEFCEKTHTIIF